MLSSDEPYRAGYEWYMPAELVRILLLTSTIGWLSRSCYVKMLVAQILSLGFLVVHLWVRPYRRGSENLMQAGALLLPVVGLSYFMVGGWEAAEGRLGGVDSDVVAHDATVLVAIHGVIFAFPVLMGLFTIISALFVWQEGRRYQSGKKQWTRKGPNARGAEEEAEAVEPYVQLGDIDAVIAEERRAYAAALHEDQRDAMAELKRKLTKRAKQTRPRRTQRHDDAAGDSGDWSSWSSSSSSTEGAKAANHQQQQQQQPARRAGGTGFVSTQGLLTQEELHVRDELRQAEEMVTLGARKPLKGIKSHGDDQDTDATTAAAADDETANRKRKGKGHGHKAHRTATRTASAHPHHHRRTTKTDKWLQSEGLGALRESLAGVETMGELLEKEGELGALVSGVEPEQRGMFKMALKHFRETVDHQEKRKRKHTMAAEARKVQHAASAFHGSGKHGKHAKGGHNRKRRSSLKRKKSNAAMKRKLSKETTSRQAQRRDSLAGRLAAYHKRVSGAGGGGGGGVTADDGGPALTKVEADTDGVHRLVPMRATTTMLMAVKMRRWAKTAKEKVTE